MPPKKEAPKKDHFVETMFVLLVIGILVLLWSMIFRTLLNGVSYLGAWQAFVAWFLHYLWPIIVVLCVLLCLASILGIIFNIRKLNELALLESKIYGPSPKEEEKEIGPVTVTNEKWTRIRTQASSQNPSDWKQAIIDADVMLEEMLRAEGYHGETLGDLLKGVDQSDMLTLESAWEGHKVRNQIAHGGSDFQLTERDAKRIISHYESVFREFGVI